MIVIGICSGTGVAAIAAAADIDLRSDGTWHLRPLGHMHYLWPTALRRRLRAAQPPAPGDVGEVCELDTLVGQEIGSAARRAVDDLAGGDAEPVASHGQTLHHWVVGGRTRGTLQIGNPAWVGARAPAGRQGLPAHRGAEPRQHRQRHRRRRRPRLTDATHPAGHDRADHGRRRLAPTTSPDVVLTRGSGR